MKNFKTTILIFFCVFVIQKIFGQDIHHNSYQSLYIESWKDNNMLGAGTGFLIQSSKDSNQLYLITNWHVITGKNPRTKDWIDTIPKNQIDPNFVRIFHRTSLGDTSLFPEFELLINDKGVKKYYEWQIGNQMVDVVAVPLKPNQDKRILFYLLDYQKTNEKILIDPADEISVIGYPGGMEFTKRLFPIWKTGTIASEPSIDFNKLPIIKIDMMGFGGMSGSPCFYISDIVRSVSKEGIINYTQSSGKKQFFIGVFSHTNPKIHVGSLWKSTYLKKLFDELP